MPDVASPPIATIAIAAYNAAAHIEAAVRSACAQTLRNIEIIVVDDRSTDETCTIVERLAQTDPRIRLDRLPINRGPAEARNRAIDLARGQWLAILDADDAFAPNRLAVLIETAERQTADIVADDMVVFEDGDPTTARFYMGTQNPPRWIELDTYLRATQMFSVGINYGYLKPVIRLDALRTVGVRYDGMLRIAEDDDLIVRLLLAGLHYWLQPEPFYAYRRHRASTSFRLSTRNAAAMVKASADLNTEQSSHPLAALLLRRHRGFVRAHDFARLVDALKARRFVDAGRIAVINPTILPLLRMPIGAAIRRLSGETAPSSANDPDARRALAAILAACR